jgi:hypothetical protein
LKRLFQTHKYKEMNYQLLVNEGDAIVAIFPYWLQSKGIEPNELYDSLCGSAHFTRPIIKIFSYNGPTPRDQIAIGDEGMDSHEYTGTSVPMISWDKIDERVEKIRQCISATEDLMALSCSSIPNSCLINYYKNGADYVGYHSDKELKDESQTVYTVTLGTPRKFVLQHKSTKRNVVVTPQAGDLLMMTGRTQELWKHAIPKVSVNRCSTGRISLTYRVL